MSVPKEDQGKKKRSTVLGGKPLRRTPVLVVNGFPIEQLALAGLLNRQSDLRSCGEVASLEEAQPGIVTQRPELVLLNLRSANADELESIRLLKARFPSLRLLVLSQLDETVHAQQAMRAGAMGYVMKVQPVAELLKAIRTVLAGEIYVSAKVRRQALNWMLKQVQITEESGLGVLSDRESHVFKALGAGKCRKEIAAHLHLSVKTVATHCEHIRYKLGLSSGAELTERARREGAPEGGQ
jgi:DNA-binding NarL/FixJ family response regulator